MIRSKPLLAALCATTALLTGAAKPTPQPTSFTPALSYLYNGQEIRLANADGSAAALLVRIPTGSQAYSILYHALAPLGQRQAAFVETPSNTVKTLRMVSWTQPTPGGPLSVTLDPTPLFTISGYGAYISSLDYSHDGTRLAVLSNINGTAFELRIFDTASRTLIGDPIPLAQEAWNLRWRSDGSILLLGEPGASSFKDGVQTPLFTGIESAPFDTFNAGSQSALFSKHQPGGAIQLWDGVSLVDDAPVLTTISDGTGHSISCDNARMIFTRLGSRITIQVKTLATGADREFSRDRGIRFPLYPRAC
jgi:hypothetical protein